MMKMTTMSNDTERGLYSKYIVLHADTGEPVEGDVFILRPDRDEAAWNAAMTYADWTPNTQLASEMYDWLMSIKWFD